MTTKLSFVFFQIVNKKNFVIFHVFICRVGSANCVSVGIRILFCVVSYYNVVRNVSYNRSQYRMLDVVQIRDVVMGYYSSIKYDLPNLSTHFIFQIEIKNLNNYRILCAQQKQTTRQIQHFYPFLVLMSCLYNLSVVCVIKWMTNGRCKYLRVKKKNWMSGMNTQDIFKQIFTTKKKHKIFFVLYVGTYIVESDVCIIRPIYM